MANYVTTNIELTATANAIRAKTGESAAIEWESGSGFADAIQAISSGGASNIVTGTFKGTTAGLPMDITLSYTGSGFPVAVVIYPKEGGNNTGGTFYDLVQRYATDKYFAVKSNTSKAPTYPSASSTADTDNMAVYFVYKSSTTTATSRSTSSNIDVNVYRDIEAGASSSGKFAVRLRSNTKMSVMIASNGSYGFAANVEYTYWVIYSS